MKRFIFNNYYILRHDKKRTFILSQGASIATPKHLPVNTYWQSMVHPVYAMMLAFFSTPTTIVDACENISRFMQVDKKTVYSFINNLLEAKEPMHTELNGFCNDFPVNLIIEEEKEVFPRVEYKPELFVFDEIDFNTRRMFSAPLSLVFMPNNNCYTKCIYCYADTKSRKNLLTFEEIEKFVYEAKSIGIRDFLITGGDIFMYRNWRQFFELLKSVGYLSDLASTKKPLSKEEISDFSKFGIRLQVSLDSVIEETASKVLNVSDGYVAKMKQSLEDIENAGISYQIATVLTNRNDSIKELVSLRDYLKTLKHLERWEIRVAFKSLYSVIDFDNIKSSRKDINSIEQWVKQNQKNFPCEILWSPDDDAKYNKIKDGSENFEGDACSANVNNMVVLPDGMVTICEQLYWNSNFVIGNVKNSTLTEIWNSKKAIDLSLCSQSSIQNDSPCSTCKIFERCFRASNRCYVNIMKAYGIDNYDYPDPRCFWAPKFALDITHE